MTAPIFGQLPASRDEEVCWCRHNALAHREGVGCVGSYNCTCTMFEVDDEPCDLHGDLCPGEG